jgi:hypothetical protein
MMSSQYAGLAKDAAMAASGAGMLGLAAKHGRHLGGKHANACGPHGHGDREYKATRRVVGPMGPPSAHVTYPYYTTRGPRDFLADNPMSIGP